MDLCENSVCAAYGADEASLQLLWECNKIKDLWLGYLKQLK